MKTLNKSTPTGDFFVHCKFMEYQGIRDADP